MRDEREVLDKIEKATYNNLPANSLASEVAVAILHGAKAVAYAIVYLGRCYVSK